MNRSVLKKYIVGAFLVTTATAFLSLQIYFKNQDSQTPSKIVRLSILEQPITLNPTKARDARSSSAISALFEGLTRRNKSGSFDLALAEGITISDDDKTYTFLLKESVWSDGTPVSSEDFLYAWQRALTTNANCNADLLYVIKNAREVKEGNLPPEKLGITIINKRTLAVELEEPTPYFLDIISQPIFFPIPKHIDQKNPSWDTKAASYVSNGPFSLKTWDSHHLLLEANPLYWDRDSVFLKGIHLMVRDPSTSVSMYKKKKLDWIGTPFTPLSAISILKLHKEDLKISSSLSTYFLRIQTAEKLLSNPSIRKALSMAIDREKISKNVTLDRTSLAKTLVPPSMGLENNFDSSDTNEEIALELFEKGLTELSISKSELCPLTLIIQRRDKSHLISHYISECWKKVLGIATKTEILSDKEWFARARSGDFDIAAGSWGADFHDPISFLQVFKYKNGNTNNTFWEDEEYIQTLDLASATSNKQERFSLLKKAEAILMNAMPIIPIYHASNTYIHNNNLKDVVLSPLNTIDFKWAYFTNGGTNE